jgi:hypothetical protein
MNDIDAAALNKAITAGYHSIDVVLEQTGVVSGIKKRAE